MRTPKALGVIVFCALAATFAAPDTARAAEAPPGRVIFDIVTVNGTGCPAGTAAVSLSPGFEAFTVQYSAFTAAVGVGASPTDWRKNCQITLMVHATAGYSYAITGVDRRGSISLATGASAVERTFYYFAGHAQTALVTHQFLGPVSDDWQTSDQIPVDSLGYSPCGAAPKLNVNTEIRVNTGTSDPATTTSSITQTETATGLYHLTWKRCA